MAAMMMEAAAGDIEFKNGSFHIVGTDRSLPLTAVAQSLHRPMFLPPQFEVGLETLRHGCGRTVELSQWLPCREVKSIRDRGRLARELRLHRRRQQDRQMP